MSTEITLVNKCNLGTHFLWQMPAKQKESLLSAVYTKLKLDIYYCYIKKALKRKKVRIYGKTLICNTEDGCLAL